MERERRKSRTREEASYTFDHLVSSISTTTSFHPIVLNALLPFDQSQNWRGIQTPGRECCRERLRARKWSCGTPCGRVDRSIEETHLCCGSINCAIFFTKCTLTFHERC